MAFVVDLEGIYPCFFTISTLGRTIIVHWTCKPWGSYSFYYPVGHYGCIRLQMCLVAILSTLRCIKRAE